MVLVLPKEVGSKYYEGGPKRVVLLPKEYYPKRVVQVIPKEGGPSTTQRGWSKYYPKRVVLVLPKEGGPSTTQRVWS